MHSGSTTILEWPNIEFSGPSISHVGQVAATSLRRGLGVGPQVQWSSGRRRMRYFTHDETSRHGWYKHL